MLRVANIFVSIDGEVNSYGQGTFSTFIRLSKCNLRCAWCDTAWAQDRDFGKDMSEDEIMKAVDVIGCEKITITGGEPLLQDIETLIDVIYNAQKDLSIETNGTMPLPKNYCKVNSWIVDRKIGCDFVYANLAKLRVDDFVKIVVWDRSSYEEAKQFHYDNLHLTMASFAFSAVSPQLSHAQLCEWMIEDELFDVKLNCQIHKFIWPKENNTIVFTGIEH
jgi:7-carboxy-7-deazaguanine synthase